MSQILVRITSLQDRGDARGKAFPLPSDCIDFLASAVDFSLMTLKPGYIRGNHYHVHGKEVLVVVHRDSWSLYWDNGPNTETQKQQFTGSGAVMIQIDRLSSHAIKNDGAQELYILHIRNTKFDPVKPDAVPCFVVT